MGVLSCRAGMEAASSGGGQLGAGGSGQHTARQAAGSGNLRRWRPGLRSPPRLLSKCLKEAVMLVSLHAQAAPPLEMVNHERLHGSLPALAADINFQR